MNRINQLRQQIDACRAGSDDLHRPELADLAKAMGDGAADPAAVDPAVVREFDRAQRFDRCVVSALHDVAVPPGLLQKLLIQASTPAVGEHADLLDGSVTAAAQIDSPPSGGDATIVSAPAGPGVRRLTFFRLVGLGIVAASLLAAGYVWWPVTPQQILQVELAGDVGNWMTEATQASGWQTGPAPSFPAADMLPRGRAIAGWRSFRTARGEPVVVFNLMDGNETVRLFVIATPHRYSVRPVPLTPLLGMTGNWNVGAWQREGGPLYVLVVGRGRRSPDDYVRVVNPA